MDRNLFVYGTLKSDFDRKISRYLRDNSEFIGPGKVNGVLYDLGSYPALVLSDNSDEVAIGEVYTITVDDVFEILDRYEGEEYERRRVLVVMATEIRECWAYEYLGTTDDFHKIEGGIYINQTI